MKIVFLSNYMTHHQLPFCQAITRLKGVEFTFVCTEKIAEERLNFGYEDLNNKYKFIVRAYADHEEQEKVQILTDEADVVIVGSAPMHYVLARLKKRKLTFRYTERLYKKQYKGFLFLKNALINYWVNGRHKSLYLLAASAFATSDYKKHRTFMHKAYKWGYFTEVKKYDDVNKLIDLKHPASILWVARFIDWKHPEVAIEVAKRLKSDGYVFKLNMIGNGELEDYIKGLIQSNDLSDCVEMLGAMKPEQVREYMEKSEIFLFTSDRNEGWGAVLNEAMNSACAVVASHAIGSVPFLLDHEVNGMIYEDGNLENLYLKVKSLLDMPQKRKKLGINAYKTMSLMWSPEIAAHRLIDLCNELLNSKNGFGLFDNGPCSEAKIIKDDWFLDK